MHPVRLRSLAPRCRFFPPSPTVIRRTSGRKPESPAVKPEGSVVVPAHQAAPGEGDRPRPARAGGRRITCPRWSKKAGRREGGSSNRWCRCSPAMCSCTAMPTTALAALRGNRLVNVLEVVDQDGLVRDLRQVYTMLSSGLPVSAEPTMPVGRDGPDHDRPVDGHGRHGDPPGEARPVRRRGPLPGPRCDGRPGGLAGRTGEP